MKVEMMLRGHGARRWLDSISMSDTLQYRMESEIIIPFLLYSVVRGLHLRSPAWATTPRLMSVWGTLKSLTRSSALRLTKILSRQEIGNSCPVTEVMFFPGSQPKPCGGFVQHAKGRGCGKFHQRRRPFAVAPWSKEAAWAPPGPRPQIQSQGRDSRMQFPAPGWDAGPEEMVSRLGKRG
jgi:hypothetical protein